MENETEKIFKEQLRKLPTEVRDFILSSSWDTDTDEIGSLYNFSEEDTALLKQEITFVLAGLIHPDEFKEVLGQEVVSNRAVLDAVVKSVEEKIFAPIRPALVAFFENENTKVPPEEESVPVFARNEATHDYAFQTLDSVQDVNLLIQPRQSTDSQRQDNVPFVPVQLPKNNDQTPNVPPSPLAPFRVWERGPDIAPDNLPTAEETEPLIPPIPPKNTNISNETPSHPFEEKMKQVFTAGQQSMGELSIEPPAPTSIVNGQLSNVPPVPAPSRPSFADPYREPIE